MRGEARPLDNRPMNVPLEWLRYGEYPCSLVALATLFADKEADDQDTEQQRHDGPGDRQGV